MVMADGMAWTASTAQFPAGLLPALAGGEETETEGVWRMPAGWRQQPVGIGLPGGAVVARDWRGQRVRVEVTADQWECGNGRGTGQPNRHGLTEWPFREWLIPCVPQPTRMHSRWRAIANAMAVPDLVPDLKIRTVALRVAIRQVIYWRRECC